VTPQRFDVSLDGLADRYRLDAAAVARLRTFGAMLAGDPLAPTTVRQPERIRDDHFADSLVALELARVWTAPRIADLGSGAGIPGLPLAIALPNTEVWLVESNGRKCEFIERAAALMRLENAHVVNARVEAWPEGRSRIDLVTARALASLDVVAEYAAPLLTIGGALVVWRGRREPQVEAKGTAAAGILGFSVDEPLRVRPYDGAEHRYLHVMSKVMETPARFPRRAGMARKRPLGAAGTRLTESTDSF
jgi:16S rRNA (guanine527-N7)-methyltransferase